MNFRLRQFLALGMAASLCLVVLAPDVAARGGRGGGGRGGGGRSGSVSRSRSHSPSHSGNLQNRGNVNSRSSRSGGRQENRGQRQSGRTDNRQGRQDNRGDRQDNRFDSRDNRQDSRTDRQENRVDNRGDRQEERTERTEIRQENRTERTDIRQENRTDRQDNRLDYLDDNYYRGWRGGGWYGRGYYVPPGWGWVGFTAGLIIGTAVASPPPNYSTVYVSSTTYIYSDGIFFQPQGDEYVVVAPPAGAVVEYIPEGCEVESRNGASYYNCSGIFYEPFYRDGVLVYRVAAL